MTKKATKPQGDPSMVAVLHRAGGSWRCLAGRLESGQARVIDLRVVPADQAGRVQGWVDQHRAGRVIVVLPSASVICRTFPLPDAPAEQIEPALRLQAEAHLLGQTPSHRHAVAVLAVAPGEAGRCGIVLAWPESSRIDIPPLDEPPTYAPEIAAIAALMNGHRPAEPILWVDRRHGSLALALSHANGVSLRSTREDAPDHAVWQAGVVRALAETALGAGHDGSFVDAAVNEARVRLSALGPEAAALVVPQSFLGELNKRIAGAPRDGAWWSQFGVAAGTLLASGGPLDPLTRLQDAPPLEAPSIVRRAVAALSHPRIAARTVVVCVGLALLSPLLVSGARLLILKIKLPDLAEHQHSVRQARQELLMYGQLKDRSWSMTKLLGDIACNMPEGIEVYSITIAHNQEVKIKGRAKKWQDRAAFDSVRLMEQRMNESRVFEQARSASEVADNFGTYEFDLFARVKAPFHVVAYSPEQDFGLKSLRVRQWPELENELDGPALVDAGGDPVGTAIGVAFPGNGEDDPTSPRADPGVESSDEFHRPDIGSGPSPGFGGDTATIADRDADGGRPSTVDIPPPLTPQQIQAMSFSEARDMLGLIAKAKKGADEDTKKRLTNEFKLVSEHMRNINNSG